MDPVDPLIPSGPPPIDSARSTDEEIGRPRGHHPRRRPVLMTVALLAGVVLLGYAGLVFLRLFPDHRRLPSLDAPRLSLSATLERCDSTATLRATTRSTRGLIWQELGTAVLEVDSVHRSVDVGGAKISVVVDDWGEHGQLRASGANSWSSEVFPYSFEKITLGDGVLVGEMLWSHAVSMGDAPPDSASVIVGIDLATGRTLWWASNGTERLNLTVGFVDEQSIVVLERVDTFDGAVRSTCHLLRVLNPSTGEERWHAIVPCDLGLCISGVSAAVPRFAVLDGYLYASVRSSSGEAVFAWESGTGVSA